MNRRIFNKIAKREGLVKIPKPNLNLKVETFEPRDLHLLREKRPLYPLDLQTLQLKKEFCEHLAASNLIAVKLVEDMFLEASLTILIKKIV